MGTRLTFGALTSVFWAAAIACGTFGSDDEPTPAPIDASTSPETSDLDAGAVDAWRPFSCDGFDASTPTVPDPRSATCNGVAGIDLFSDRDNCGACGHRCQESTCDGAGHCIPTAFADDPGAQPSVQAVDGAFLYWIDGSRVRRGARDKSSASAIVTENDGGDVLHFFQQIVPGDQLYIRYYGFLGAAPLGGGPAVDFASIYAYGRLAVGPADLAVTEPGADRVRFFAHDGGALDTVAGQGGAQDVAITPDGRWRFWINRRAADAGDGGYTATLYRRDDRQSINLGEIGIDPSVGQALAADDQYLFLVGPDGAVYRRPVDAPPGTPPTLLAQKPGWRIGGLVLDEQRVYWFWSDASPYYYYWDLVSVSKCGGPVTTHLERPNAFTTLPAGLAVDDQYLYWGFGTKVVRVAK